MCENRSLVYCGYIIFQLFDIQHILHIDESIAVNWLTLMESNYHSSCAYHNSTHAADVMQAAAYLCNQDRLLVSEDYGIAVCFVNIRSLKQQTL
jgi:high affinity cAMP-specific and IBMX-insensitive 3',5'-cyclic phosphodiesterase 8